MGRMTFFINSTDADDIPVKEAGAILNRMTDGYNPIKQRFG
jgi:hypothetical protein